MTNRFWAVQFPLALEVFSKMIGLVNCMGLRHRMDLRSLFMGTRQKVLRKCVPLCSPELAGRRIPALEALRCQRRGVAQLGSAGALGALGRRFESCRPD